MATIDIKSEVNTLCTLLSEIHMEDIPYIETRFVKHVKGNQPWHCVQDKALLEQVSYNIKDKFMLFKFVSESGYAYSYNWWTVWQDV